MKRQQAATCCHIVIRTHNHCSLLYNFSFTTGSLPFEILASLWMCYYILYMGMSNVWWMVFKWGRLLTTGTFGDKCRAPVNNPSQKFLSGIPLRNALRKAIVPSQFSSNFIFFQNFIHHNKALSSKHIINTLSVLPWTLECWPKRTHLLIYQNYDVNMMG